MKLVTYKMHKNIDSYLENSHDTFFEGGVIVATMPQVDTMTDVMNHLKINTPT